MPKKSKKQQRSARPSLKQIDHKKPIEDVATPSKGDNWPVPAQAIAAMTEWARNVKFMGFIILSTGWQVKSLDVESAYISALDKLQKEFDEASVICGNARKRITTRLDAIR